MAGKPFKQYIQYILLLIFSFFLFYLLILPNENFFSENSSFYFLSSLLQANASILSIAGVFFIFRIQSLQSSIDIIKNILMSDRGHSSWPAEIVKFDNLSLNEKESHLRSGNANEFILSSLQDWTSKERSMYSIKKEIKIPAIIIGLGIIIEAVCLFLANYFHTHHNIIEYYIMYINLLLEVFIILTVIKSIFKAI